MNSVISADIAKQITGGRRPLVPVEYDRALKALRECQQIDDAKYWSDKADALAAWAKIYHSNEAERQAKMLKLHAYRRMGELADELRPKSKPGYRDGKRGSDPGSRKLLIEYGLSAPQAAAARILARLPESEFLKRAEHGPSPQSMARMPAKGSDAWIAIVTRSNFIGARSFCRQNDARILASQITCGEIASARALITELSEWLDKFEQHLTKAKYSDG